MRATTALSIALLSLAVGARADRGSVTVQVEVSRSGMIEIGSADEAPGTQRPISRADVTLICPGHEHHARTNMRGVASFALHHATADRLQGIVVSRPGFQGVSVDGDVNLPERGPVMVLLPAGGCSGKGCQPPISRAFSRQR